jgi:hypothetical protein
MVVDVRTLAAQAAALEVKLRTEYPDAVVPITSVKAYGMTEHREGVTIEVPYGVASRHISRGTHRLGTKEEQDAFHADLNRRNDEYRQRELQRRVDLGQVAVIQEGQLKPIQTQQNRRENK